MDLYTSWEQMTKNVSIEHLTFSVSEIINRYEKNRININPAYQRLYRWTNNQKSNFIESLLLGYPIPPIFLYKSLENKRQGEYEVIDGLQRLASIFEFVGILHADIIPKEKLLKLEETYILKTLKDKTWNDFKENGLDFVLESSSLQAVILDSKNDRKLKYEIFRRLNSSSTKLSPQEIRNATLAETSPRLYANIEKTLELLDFSFLSETDKNERKDLEMFLVFVLIDQIIYHKDNVVNILTLPSYSKMLDDFSFTLTEDQLSAGLEKFIVFMKTYSKYSFKKYIENKNRFEGLFINVYFEILATLHLKNPNTEISNEKIKDLFKSGYQNWLSEVKLVNPDAKTRMLKAIGYADGLPL